MGQTVQDHIHIVIGLDIVETNYTWYREWGNRGMRIWENVGPSNYMYIKLSARKDASPTLGCLHGLSMCSAIVFAAVYIIYGCSSIFYIEQLLQIQLLFTFRACTR